MRKPDDCATLYLLRFWKDGGILEKINYFNYAAIAVIGIILISALHRGVGRGHGNKAFLITVLEFLFTAFADIGAVALDNSGSAHIAGKYFFHSAYLLLHTVSTLFYLFYLISLTDTWSTFLKKKWLLICILAPGLFYLELVIVNLFGIADLFHFDASGTYIRGTWFGVGYLVGAFYLLAGLLYIIHYRKLFSANWILTLFAPYPFILASLLIQYYIPAAVVEMFFNALALLFVYTDIQKPEELTDPVTQLFNLNAFEDYSRRAFFNRKDTTAVIIDIKNYDVMHDTVNLDILRDYLVQCARAISAVSDRFRLQTDAFSGEKGRFFIFVDNRYKDRLRGFAEALSAEFNRIRLVDGAELHPRSSVSVISLQEHFSGFSDFIRFAGGSLDRLRGNSVYLAEELFKDNYYKILLNVNRIILDALQYDHFEVYYQPIYSCRLKRFVSAEALLRLKDPEFGFVPPDVFIPAAERSGLIVPISDYILKTVCGFISGERFKTLGIEYIEVNLSAVECIQDNLEERVMSSIRRASIPCSCLSLEITETALIYDAGKLKKNLFALSNQGLRICLDDYGSGYSDTRRIIDLPISIVKLDRSFLLGAERKLNQVILQDTVRMINDVGNHVVAEGVETKEQLRLLEGYGCDLIQGYYFSKPLPREDFEKLCLNQAGIIQSLVDDGK